MLNYRSYVLCGVLPLVVGLVAGLGLCQAQETERVVFAMGTWLHLRADSPQTAERALREIERVEGLLSRWQPNSDIAKLNRAEGARPKLRDNGNAERPAHADTTPKAAFADDATTFSTQRRLAPVVSNALERAAHWQRWSDGAFRVRSGEAEHLDTDAFAKGAALDQAIRVVTKVSGEYPKTGDATSQARSGLNDPVTRAELIMNFGGQVAVLNQSWTGSLSSPNDRSHATGPDSTAQPDASARLASTTSAGSAAGLFLSSGSLSTSGNTVKPGHIVDPRTGAGTPVLRRGQVTVWAPNAFDADCASTACFVLGPKRALQKVNATPNLECCFEWFEHQVTGPAVLHRRVSTHWNQRTQPKPKP